MSALSLGSLSASDNAALCTSGVDLYYRDGNGNNVRLTQSGSIVGTAGSISGLGSPASASYVSGSGTFIWQSAALTSAIMDMGSIILRPTTASANGVTIAPPAGLGANYTMTLPAGVPASTLPLQMDSSGNVSAAGAGSFVPPGVIMPYGGTSAPAGYLLCDGTSYLRASYSALFGVISTAYGAADGTHFNVPDLRGQFLRGVTGASANDPDASSRTAMNTGGNTGNNVGSVQGQATKKNGLALSDPGHSHVANGQNGNLAGTATNFVAIQSGVDHTSGTDIVRTTTTGISLGSGDSETRPVNAYVNYIIKT